MTPFDRLAWRCSYIAPLALVGTLVVGALAFSARAHNNALAAVAFALACLSIVAHSVVHYHSVRPGSFGGKRHDPRLGGAMRLSNYEPWRERMRAEYPQLGRRGKKR